MEYKLETLFWNKLAYDAYLHLVILQEDVFLL
jgi:hypothetical protein